MKQLLFLFLLYTATITSNIRTAAAYINDERKECQICLIEDDLTALCSTASDHSLSCPNCRLKVLSFKECGSCNKPFSLIVIPTDLQASMAEETIKKKRIDVIQSRIDLMKEDLPNGQPVFDTRATRELRQAITAAQEKKNEWEFAATICRYRKAWLEIETAPEGVAIPNTVGEIMESLSHHYDLQEIVHLIGRDPGRFATFLRKVENTFETYSEGDDLDTLGNLQDIAHMPMTLQLSK